MCSVRCLASKKVDVDRMQFEQMTDVGAMAVLM